MRRIVTDEGSPLKAGLTAARTFANFVACGEAASAPSEEGAGAPKGYKGATEGEITRGCCLHRGEDEHRVKKRSFAFTLAYIKCFRTYSLYLSLRLPAQILYAGIHLPPQREARALPRSAQIFQRCMPKFFLSPRSFCPYGAKIRLPLTRGQSWRAAVGAAHSAKKNTPQGEIFALRRVLCYNIGGKKPFATAGCGSSSQSLWLCPAKSGIMKAPKRTEETKMTISEKIL